MRGVWFKVKGVELMMRGVGLKVKGRAFREGPKGMQLCDLE